MIDISKATSLLQSLAADRTAATKTTDRAGVNSGTDAKAFVNKLQQNLQETSQPSAQKIPTSHSTKPLPTADLNVNNKCTCESGVNNKLLFGNFEEFQKWEKGLGGTFANDYKPPDYIRMISLSLSGGDSEAFKRYVFFKNNPQYAADYESIRNGNLSKFPTDGSTLVKTDLSKIDAETAEYYRKNPNQLLAAEGFSMDPTLLKKRMDGDSTGITDPDWLMQHRWTRDGAVASNNRLLYAQSAFIGLDGKGAENYRLAKYDSASGLIVDLDGRKYDPNSGKAAA